MKSNKILKRLLITVAVLAVLIILYLLIYSAVIAFSPGITITEEMITKTTYIQPDTNETLMISQDTMYLSKNLETYIIKNRELQESIISYEYEGKTYYFKFITQDKIYSTQFKTYLYKAW